MAYVSTTGGIITEIAARLRKFETREEDFYLTELNLGLRDIQTTFPNASFLQTSADRTLSSGTRIYTNLPSDFEKMNSITYPAGDIRITYLAPQKLDTLQPSASEGGNPTVYTIRGQGSNGRIEFYPVPGSSLTVHYDYIKEVPTVSAFSSIPEIPEKYYDLLVMFGEYRGLRRSGFIVESREVKNEYETLKNRMIQDLQRETNENSRIKSVREFQKATRTYDDPIKNIYWNQV